MFDGKTRTENRRELKSCLRLAKDWEFHCLQSIFIVARIDDAHGYEFDKTMSRFKPDMVYRAKHEARFVEEVRRAWVRLLSIPPGTFMGTYTSGN